MPNKNRNLEIRIEDIERKIDLLSDKLRDQTSDLFTINAKLETANKRFATLNSRIVAAEKRGRDRDYADGKRLFDEVKAYQFSKHHSWETLDDQVKRDADQSFKKLNQTNE